MHFVKQLQGLLFFISVIHVPVYAITIINKSLYNSLSTPMICLVATPSLRAVVKETQSILTKQK